MSQHPNDGGPAFPQPIDDTGHPVCYGGHGGMSLRDYFAGQALSGLISIEDERPLSDDNERNDAKYCYKLADAMLAAREKGGKV